MAQVPTPEQVKHLLRGTHPADRDKVAQDTYRAPVAAAKAQADKVMAASAAHTASLKAEVEKLTAQLSMVSVGLEQRKRMTPQDMRDALNGLFATYNFSPAEELVLMLKDPSHPYYIMDAGMRVAVLKELNSYVMPKLKSTEITGEVKHKHTIVIKRFGADGGHTIEAPAPPPALEVPAEVRHE